MAPTITQAEKDARRKGVKAKRRKAGKKLRPLPPAKAGADQGYKEFKIVVYYDQEQEHRSVSVTRGDCEVAGAIMRRDACRINLSRADDTAGLFDGAEWIRNQVEKVCLNLKAIGLDFYHLAENVHKCRKAVFGEENPAGRQWAGEVLHTVKHEGYEPFRARLEELRTRLGRSRAKRAAADRLIEYAEHRREMIAYPEFLAAGRHIGSGPTESMCKAVTLRLKGSGMRWDADNAEAVAALEALYQSGQWNAWWKRRLKPAI